MSEMRTFRVDELRVGERAREDLGDVAGLAASIDELGLLQPIGVTPDGEVVYGVRRLAAIRRLGWTEVACTVVDLPNPAVAERDENEQRKEFTPSERVAVAKRIEQQFGIRQGRRTELRGNGGEVGSGRRTAAVAAERAGFASVDEYRRAAVVVDRGTPELVRAMDAGAVTVSAAAEVARLPPAEQTAAVANGTVAVTAKAMRERRNGRSPASSRRATDKPPTGPVGSAGVDPNGVRIPDGVGDHFGDRMLPNLIARLVTLRDQATAVQAVIQTEWTRRAEGFPFCHWEKAHQSVKAAAAELAEVVGQLEAGVPYCVCPKCGGTGCKWRRQTGYWPKHLWDAKDQFFAEV